MWRKMCCWHWRKKNNKIIMFLLIRRFCFLSTDPPTEPVLTMRSNAIDGWTITVTCSVKSFPQSTLTLMRINTNHQSLKITENNLYSRPINSLSHKINVTSADAGLYVCSAKNSLGSRDSEQKELVVKCECFSWGFFFSNQTDQTKTSFKKSLHAKVAFLLYFSINYYLLQLKQ